MLGPTRPMPMVGSRARVSYFGGSSELALVIAVHEGGRRLEVRGEGGDVFEFVLNPSTAKFVRAGKAIAGERLELLQSSP